MTLRLWDTEIEGQAPHMPDGITWRRTKIDFNSPIVDWMRGPLRNFKAGERAR